MSFIAEMAALAAELAASDMFADATLTRIAPASFDPVTGAVVPQGAANFPCRAVAALVTTKAADGALVTNTVLTLNVEPQEGDKLAMGSATYVVGEVRKEAPHGDALIWTAVAKR